MDKRDGISWVVFELSYLGEQKVEEGYLSKILQQEHPFLVDHSIFIPSLIYSKSNEIVTFHLMEGYIFIATGLDDSLYFELETSPYIQKVVTSGYPFRTLNTVQDHYIQSLRAKLREMTSLDLIEGMEVKILEGTYSKLQGKILDLFDDVVSILVEMRSANFIVSLPKAFLEPLDAEV